ncbi:MAG: T9SS type A sorting domain-containing protein [Cyclobacteriaceae bacterium]
MNRILLLVSFLMGSWISYAQPSTQASNISVTPVVTNGTSLTLSWTNGNGTNRIVIVRTGVYTPINGVAAPSSNSVYGSGTDLDPAGGPTNEAYCVFNSQTDGGGNNVTVTGLTDKTRYTIQVIEYNGTGASTLFHVTAGANNPLSIQSFASNGTFNQPTNVTKVSVATWGGGGGGGGADSNGGENRAGGGGAGGSYTLNTNVTIAGNQTVTIGAGGTGGDGSNSPQNGAAGGTTSFGALVSAVGGAGGLLANGSDRTGNGGVVTVGTTANGGAGGEAPPGGTGTNATASGAGGASGGPGGNGGSASGSTAGAAVTGGGAGAPGNTTSPPTEGNNATQLGGGGSGGWDNQQNDNSGNGSNGGNGFRGQAIVTWTGPPVPSITVLGPTPTSGNPLFQVVFSTPINTGSFTGTDVAITGTATGTLVAGITEVAPNNGTTFNITVTGMTGSGTVIADIAAGVLTDASGNSNLISNSGTTITYNHDVTGPTVAISVSGPDPTNANPVFQVVFNEPINVSTFAPGDVSLSGTAGATTAVIAEIAPNDGTTFTITASGMTGAGTVIADIAAGLIEDLAGNTNSISNAGTSITYDNVAPTVVLNDNHADNIVRDADNVTITAVFTEANGLSGTPTITIAGLTPAVSNVPMSGGPLSWTYVWNVPSGNNGSHAVTISATDLAGNPSAPATAGTGPTSYIIDNTPPTVVLNDDHPDAIVRDADNVTITAVFTEANGISGTPTITIAGLTPSVSNVPMSGGPLTWTYLWDVPAGNDGAHAVSISATDVAGNPNTAATAGSGPTSYTIDNTPPVISATAPASSSSVGVTEVSYTLSETVASGSITWINTGGNPDVGAPHVQALTGTELNSGSQNNIVLTNNPTLVNGAVYTMTFNATDAAGNSAVPITNTNITFETASSSSIIPISSPVTIGSLMDNSGNSANVLQFTIFDDGQDPIVPNVMTLNPNGVSQETITFSLREELTLAEGAFVSGFTSSNGSVVNARYSGKGTTNIITLTNNANNAWNGSTTISYNAVTGNAQFLTLGKMQEISAHPVSTASENTQTFLSNGSFLAPPGVTSVTVEAWGGGGAGATFSSAGFGSGGGGGGGYSRSLLTVTPGNSYSVVVGAGGSSSGLPGNPSSFDGTQVVAAGGSSGLAPSSGGQPGLASSGIGNVKFSGGSGGNGNFILFGTGTGGGGGSSAGTGANGNSGFSPGSGGSAPSGGGAGGFGNTFGGGGSGSFPGGGGGGSGSSVGGLGANGQVLVTYSTPAAGGPSEWNSDNAPFKFSDLVITQGAGNSAALSNWQDIIAGAELFDGSNTVTGTVNASDITFSAIPSTTNADLGFIDDANGGISSKTYTLKVWLRNNLSSSLAASVDGLNLDFRVDPTLSANLTYNDISNGELSSRLITTHQPVASGANQIDVVATQLDFSTQPDPGQFVASPITSVSVAPDFTAFPVVRARDANGNTDLNLGGTVTLSSGVGLLPNTATMTSGVAQLSAPQYQDAGNGMLTATRAGLTAGISSAVTVSYSNTTTITSGSNFEPVTVSSLFTNTYDVMGYDFSINEDNLGGGDGSPTRMSQIVITQGPGNTIANWTEAIAGAILYDGSFPYPVGTINATNITFSGLDFSPGRPGYVGDNASKNYQIYYWLKSSLGGSLPTTIDGLNLVFRLQDSNITLAPLSSAFTGTEDDNSGAAFNEIAVTASKLVFSTNPSSTLLLAKDIALQPPVPVIEALDFNNNRDLDFNSTAVTTTNSGGLIMSNLPGNGSIINGLLTFPNNFQFISGTGSGITLNVGATGPSAVSNATSTSFTVQKGVATTISAGAAAPATISSLETNSLTPVTVFNFDVNDDPGGTPANNDDGLPTLLSTVVITANGANNTITDWSQAIAGASLEDGTNSINAVTISSNSITFSGIPTTVGTLGHVPDNATKNYSLKIYLKSALGGTLPTTIDGLKFEFQVLESNITLGSNSTSIIAAESSTSGNNNVVDVTATSLRFLSPVAPTSASLNTDLPGISVEAVDINNNRDLGFNGASGTVRALTNPSGATMTNAPVVNTTQFSSGLLNFASNFKYTTGTNGDDVTLTIKAGTGTTCGAGAICATSPMITLQSSFESTIVADPTYTYSPTLAYVNHQENTNIQNTPTSLEIARMLLVDGSRSFPFVYGGFPLDTNSDLDGQPNNDLDGAPTTLNSITIRINNPSNLRRIELYSSGAPLGTEIDVTAIGAINAATPFYDFVFTGSPLLTAPDDGIVPLSIRASFRSTAPEVTDGDPLDVQIVAATLGTGSGFFTGPPAGPYIAGVPNGTQSPPGVNLVNVLATKLDFVSQPAAFAGINRTVTAGTVEAHDQLGLLDANFNNGAILSAAVPVNGSFSFASGVLDMSAMQYGNPGDGTITVSSGGLTSDVNNTVGGLPNVAVQCTQVDVLHVTTTYTDGGPGGVVTSPNLVGGTSNKVVFGFKFNAPHTVSTPNHPLVSKFRITFSQSTANVFTSNFRVFENENGPTYSPTLPEVTTLGATVSQPTPNTLEIDFTGSPRDLVTHPDLSYFLMVDVDINANGSTPQMTISVVDDNIEFSTTDNNIIVSNGTSFSNTFSPTAFSFAQTFPPSLVSSYPAVGQSNVDPAQGQLELTFSVPVYTLDNKVILHDKLSGVTTELTAANGQYLNGTGTVAQPIIFTIPPGTLQQNREYYVTIAQGNRTNLTGIMDDSENLFPGISFSGTLFFKTSDFLAPLLLGPLTTPSASSGPTVTDITPNGATLNATFDRKGRAYFMVLASNSTPPTNDEIKGTAPYVASPVIARGNFAVNSSNPVSQFGVIAPASGSFAPGTHYVWMYAEAFVENNHVQTPIPTSAPYGAAPNFTDGGTGPTLTFVAPAVTTGPIKLNLPNISFCNNSYQVLNAPIIISEGANNQFNAGITVQTMNFVLPAGYQFDVSQVLGSPKYGSITLQGSDFVPGSGSLGFLGNSILTIQYRNNASLSRDKIIISGLRVIASGSSTGNVFRLGGNALPSIADGQAIATLSSFNAPFINFDNSYSTDVVGISQPGAVVTAIPDNTQPQSIELTPYISSSSDFGPSSFSGTGVNVNVLNLSAVTLDVPFNITVTHTDQNGCISNNAVQYLVYDHNTAVNITDALDDPDQGPYCITNTNFVVDAINSPTYGQVVRKVDYDNLPSHYMETLTATIPASANPPVGPPTQIINATANGGAWIPIIQGLPKLAPNLPPPNENPKNISGIDYRSYTFDEAEILDANAISGGAIPDPYSHFRRVTPFQLNTFYTGGSLGFVEFEGTYRNSSNTTVQVPRRQLVEFFLPAVPIVELGLSNRSALDTTDPLNPVGSGGPSNIGTPIFCQEGGLIGINGYPAATAGASIGTFSIENVVTGLPIIGPAADAFVDNSNGTATLNPSLFASSYFDITDPNSGSPYDDLRITYTFQENNSPCQSSGSQIIRISPNPVASFSQASIITPETPTAGDYCENKAIVFDGTASGFTGANGGTFIDNFHWDFGDPNLATGSNPNQISGPVGTADLAQHIYVQSARYTVGLTATSNVGCSSPVFQDVLDVGAIPDVAFDFDGVSTDVPMNFYDNSSVSSAPIVSDDIGTIIWDFGDGPPTGSGATTTHQYTAPDIYSVEATVSSLLGCTNRLTQEVVMVDKFTPTDDIAYEENFESTNGNWQVYTDPTFAGSVSWQWGTPTTTVINTDSSIVGNNIWTTNLTDSYSPQERSYLYTPCFDMTQLLRPMISFNSMVQLEEADGVVVEYSTDNKNIADPTKTWELLGDFELSQSSGVDWYNALGLASKPGDQVTGDYGWSGSSNDRWMESKHILDEINDPTLQSNVVFRYGIASVNTSPNSDGFALDNIRIGNRTRTILLESFTNKANPNSVNGLAIEKRESDFIKTNTSTIGTELVKINYHVGFPAIDPFNLDNPADPSSRALYYNITQTPLTRLDGYKNPGQTEAFFSTWGNEQYGIRTLQLAQAELIVDVNNGADGSLQVDVQVNPKVDLGANTVLHVAILEKSIAFSDLNPTQSEMIATGETDFEFVMKKMLPSALGTRFNQVAPAGQVKPFGPFNWYPEKATMYKPANDLAVIVFLQNEDTREILQSEIKEGIADPPLVTGINKDVPLEEIAIYPNPADDQIEVQLPLPAQNRMRLLLSSQLGVISTDTVFEPGQQTKTINTKDLAAGIYFIQIQDGEKRTVKKVMIVHR